MKSIAEITRERCSGCEYKHPSGCLRSNYLTPEEMGVHMDYGSESGFTVLNTELGIVIYPQDIRSCDLWNEQAEEMS